MPPGLARPLLDIAVSNFGIVTFGFNTLSGSFAGGIVGGLPSNWTADTPGGILDGFGDFLVVTDIGPMGSRQNPELTFSITGIGGDVPLDYAALSSVNGGQDSVFFAAHVAGFLHEGTGEESAWFGGSTLVPLPAAAWLFGSALIGLVVVARRRLGALKHGLTRRSSDWAPEASPLSA